MLDETRFPHFIPDKPQGEDVFEGKSQERLAASICNYIKSIDVKPDKEDGLNIPRIIGLEGGWGTGKSNVVNMIGEELSKVGYYIFTYDAWAHQEDLQRRSIIETLTSELTSNEVLTGKVTIKTRIGDSITDTWKKQLQLLLSNKTIIQSHSVPSLSWAAIWAVSIAAVYGICIALADKIIGYACPLSNNWWIYGIPVIFAILVGLGYLIKDNSLKNAMKMVNKSEEDTTTFQYTSSDEPSVAEFKNWMKAISDYLGSDIKRNYKKLIIVFDNMDRLPSEKVMQLWSCIYSFFADGEFENVWTVIPYDYKHLCEAIYGSEEKDKDTERIKQFISKTFPVNYHVPQPVITDYKRLFYTYFDKAFGNDEHDREHICQVFTHLRPQANPRTVIRFINELVTMRLQWNDPVKYRLQNLALYVLKKDYIHYEGNGLDMQLLSEELFEKIGAFYPEREKMRTELCQYAYGLEDEKLAGELPLRNELKRLVAAGERLKEYAGRENFIPVLEDVLKDVDEATVNNATKSLASLDGVELNAEEKEHIQKKWDMLANKKCRYHYKRHEYDETLTVLINHATERRAVEMARVFANIMQHIGVKDGAAYFRAQNELQRALRAANVTFDDSDWYDEMMCSPEQFVDYVIEAKKLYAKYGMIADMEELNTYLLNGAKDANEAVATAIDYIKGDDRYDFSELREDLATLITMDEIKENIYTAAYVHRVLAEDDGILKIRMRKETISNYLNSDRASWEIHFPKGIEDVLAMSLADGKDQTDIDDELLPRICDCMGRYLNYTDVLQNLGKDGSLFRKLNIYCVEHHRGYMLNTKYVARQLKTIQQSLKLEIDMLLNHFNRWPAIDWGEIDAENEYVKSVRDYAHQSFFVAYRENPGKFSDSVIKLGVGAIESQRTGFLVSAKQVIQNYSMVTKLVVDGYWKAFVETYLGTEYMPQAEALLTNEAVTMLQWLYDHNEVTDAGLLETLLKYADEGTLKNYLHKMLNAYIAKINITKAKFLWFGKLLPLLGADMDHNTARGLMTYFFKPIIKDTECAAVIVGHKDFYLNILRKDTAFAEPIVREMTVMDAYAEIVEELKTIKSKDSQGGDGVIEGGDIEER